MACDVALMELARSDGVGVLRIYEWSEPTVSFGRHERVRDVYSPTTLSEHGFSAVRRPTGGRALLHSREVTYSVVMPISDDVRWTASYDAVNARLLSAMQSLGVPARIVGQAVPAPTVAPHSETQVCFSGIAKGEIAVGERKLIASAVWRERGAYLQHGSIQIHDDQHKLAVLVGPSGEPPEPAAGLSEWLASDIGLASVTDRVECALEEAFGDCGKCERWSIPRGVLADVEIVRRTFADAQWLWRR